MLPELSIRDIDTLDLSMVQHKLMDPEEGEGWTSDYTELVAREYRRFLALTRAYPERAVVPSGPVDKFWHNHILDTQQYGPDCQAVFGYFLHHFPYFGMRGAEDAANLVTSWESTVDLYQRHFGAPPAGLWEQGARCPKCGRVEPFALPRNHAPLQ